MTCVSFCAGWLIFVFFFWLSRVFSLIIFLLLTCFLILLFHRNHQTSKFKGNKLLPPGITPYPQTTDPSRSLTNLNVSSADLEPLWLKWIWSNSVQYDCLSEALLSGQTSDLIQLSRKPTKGGGWTAVQVLSWSTPGLMEHCSQVQSSVSLGPAQMKHQHGIMSVSVQSNPVSVLE